MDETPRFRITEKVLFGLALVALGAIFILDNLHLIYAGRLWDYWPIVMIVPGLARLLAPNRPGQRVWGAILVALGGLFLLRNLAILWIPFHRVWPALLVVLGLYLVWQATTRRAAASTTVEGASNPGSRAFDGARAGLAATAAVGGPAAVSELNEFALCGGGHRIVQASDFRGGTITVIAGGFDIDLREAAMTRESVTVELFVMMGGVVFRVPEGWKVVVNVTPMLGGSDLKARTVPNPDGSVRTLVLNGFILMGGIEVKN